MREKIIFMEGEGENMSNEAQNFKVDRGAEAEVSDRGSKSSDKSISSRRRMQVVPQRLERKAKVENDVSGLAAPLEENREVGVAFEAGDKKSAFESLCRETGMDVNSPEAKESFDKMWAAKEEGKKPHEDRELDKMVDFLKTLPPKTREQWGHAFMPRAGWDKQEVDQALRLAAEVVPAPLADGEGAGEDGGIGTAPEGEEEEAKIGATPLDEDVAKQLREADAALKNGGTPEQIEHKLRDWIKSQKERGLMAGKDTMKVAFFLAITAIFAYIWMLKTIGQYGGKGGK